MGNADTRPTSHHVPFFSADFQCTTIYSAEQEKKSRQFLYAVLSSEELIFDMWAAWASKTTTTQWTLIVTPQTLLPPVHVTAGKAAVVLLQGCCWPLFRK